MNLKLRERENHQGLGVFTSREIFGTVDMKHYVMAEECKFEKHQGLGAFTNREIFRKVVMK